MGWISLLTLLVQISLFWLIMSLVFRASPLTLSLRVVDQLVRGISGAPVPALSRITPQLYVGGQHNQRGWQKMQALGITAIVNMREAQFDDMQRGIAPPDYLHLPTPDGTSPSLEQLEQGVAFISATLAKGGIIYIHCASGFHRAPTMAVAYLIATGVPVKDALAQIKKVRPFARPIRAQTQQLEAFGSLIKPP
jgi:protein tyrosine phosphatase (PTP) superfamily phosphohydrolase (DUF442 family)